MEGDGTAVAVKRHHSKNPAMSCRRCASIDGDSKESDSRRAQLSASRSHWKSMCLTRPWRSGMHMGARWPLHCSHASSIPSASSTSVSRCGCQHGCPFAVRTDRSATRPLASCDGRGGLRQLSGPRPARTFSGVFLDELRQGRQLSRSRSPSTSNPEPTRTRTRGPGRVGPAGRAR
jgi:hypothetical protein